MIPARGLGGGTGTTRIPGLCEPTEEIAAKMIMLDEIVKTMIDEHYPYSDQVGTSMTPIYGSIKTR
jgi:hypothetical protein